MKISRFRVNIIRLMATTIGLLIVFVPNWDLGMFNSGKAAFCVVVVFGLIIMGLTITDELREVVVFRYKITKKEHEVNIKYLTLWFLIIPYWEKLDPEIHSTKVQNLFGAKTSHIYYVEKDYQNTSNAKMAIYEHKLETKRKRREFFTLKESKSPKVTIIK